MPNTVPPLTCLSDQENEHLGTKLMTLMILKIAKECMHSSLMQHEKLL